MRHACALGCIGSALLLLSVAQASASDPTLPPSAEGAALLDALSRVPNDSGVRASAIGYVDHRAMEVGRPGAARPRSFAELQALLDADDPAGALWLSAHFGVASGSTEFLERTLGDGARWPHLLGFDLLDIDLQLSFGAPPSDGLVLIGSFDPLAIEGAFGARGYAGTDVGPWRLLCGDVGCERGMEQDIAPVDPAIPFGGRIGRREPLAVSRDVILSSADIRTVRAMMAVGNGSVRSLAGDRAYRGVVAALDPGVRPTQAWLVPGSMVGPTARELAALAYGRDPSSLLARLGSILEPMPPYELAAIVDGASPTEQLVSIVLAYLHEADASAAAPILERRLGTVRSLRQGKSVSDVLEGVGVDSWGVRVAPSVDGADAAVVLELRAPLAGDRPDPATGRPEPSSQVYRALASMLLGGDTLWLVPSLPLPGE